MDRETITKIVDKIYSDQSLSAEQKHAKTLVVLNKELAKAKIGPGVRD